MDAPAGGTTLIEAPLPTATPARVQAKVVPASLLAAVSVTVVPAQTVAMLATAVRVGTLSVSVCVVVLLHAVGAVTV